MNLTLFMIEMRSYYKSIILWSVFLSIILAAQLILMHNLIDITLGYLSLIMLFAINLSLAIYAINAGSRSLIKEEAKGTIEYIYAQPISRSSIVFTKIITAVLSYAIILTIVGFVCMMTYYLIILPQLSFETLFAEIGNLFLCSFVIGLFFMAIGFMISALKSNNKHTSGTSLLIVSGTYIAGILSVLPNLKFKTLEVFNISLTFPSVLENLGYLSPFMMVPSLFEITPTDTSQLLTLVFSQIFINQNIYYALDHTLVLIVIFCVFLISLSVCFIVYKNKDLKI
ncbi:hypothetical protein SDC9_35336 [bioreactor metagenome]|uniref:ABC-2 type transporter domain-containing protein n=1 Tax=bioreactor metagenome TaxID=1076179 RepID=A0A644VF37_9ZZZZ|nr:ABC transporter permease subunit [Methanocorpusculum sp.]